MESHQKAKTLRDSQPRSTPTGPSKLAPAHALEPHTNRGAARSNMHCMEMFGPNPNPARRDMKAFGQTNAALLPLLLPSPRPQSWRARGARLHDYANARQFCRPVLVARARGPCSVRAARQLCKTGYRSPMRVEGEKLLHQLLCRPEYRCWHASCMLAS